jgi:hypothetical protein
MLSQLCMRWTFNMIFFHMYSWAKSAQAEFQTDLYTVGAQSITRFLKKDVFLLRYISGHRQDRELCLFFVWEILTMGIM